MLILTRRVGESLRIGDDVSVTVLGIKGSQVRLGVNAPKSVSVHREEVYDRINDENSKLSTKAQMKNKNKLEMEFNAPESMITDRYDSLDGDIELHWKIEWIKSSP